MRSLTLISRSLALSDVLFALLLCMLCSRQHQDDLIWAMALGIGEFASQSYDLNLGIVQLSALISLQLLLLQASLTKD